MDVIRSWTCWTPFLGKGVDARAVEPLRGSLAREKRLDTCQALFLAVAVRADDHDGFAELLHAADDVTRTGGAPIPERDEHVAGLRHLMIAAHTSGLPEALPVGAEELMLDLMLPRPAIAELIGATGSAGDDLRDAMAIRREHLAQALIVGERA